MRVDVVTIFPEYLEPVRLALLGRAQTDGLLAVHTHDLRDWTSDRHRTVDDTPYGGGPGMVMRPEPWGAAIDALLADPARPPDAATLVVPTPSGVPLDQAMVARLAARPWLVVACGRYEGIDQRVVEHYADRLEVVEVSLGDYVLNGGEAAALVIIEAVARLLPGFVGNPASLDEESHNADDEGALEYPVYTRPPSWRGLEVPEVLLSGHHGQIAAWRREQAVRRTAARRPDLAHPSRALTVAGLAGDAEVRLATPADAAELLVLQRCCWVSEAQANDAIWIPPLVETLADVRMALEIWTTFVLRAAGRLVGSVRGRLAEPGVWEIGRVMVAPDLEGRGLGRWLLRYAEQAAPVEATSYRLFTGAGSERNLRMYRRAGYRRVEPPEAAGDATGIVWLARAVRNPDDFG